MDRAKFFAAVRSLDVQVEGIEVFLDWAGHRRSPIQHAAAILAEAHQKPTVPAAGNTSPDAGCH